jgi:isopenicillin N synthase-like dioxygenase
MTAIATVDISRWYAGGTEADAVAAEVDAGLQRAGFIVVTGHGVDQGLAAAVRAASREFFALPDEVKRRYSVPVGGHGWIGPGAEANGYAEGTETPPDLKESFSLGAETATGDPEVDRIWFAPNVWPAEVPALQTLVDETPPRCAGCPTICSPCSRTHWGCRRILLRRWPIDRRGR